MADDIYTQTTGPNEAPGKVVPLPADPVVGKTYGFIEIKDADGNTITFEGGGGSVSVGIDEGTSDYEHPHRGMADGNLTKADAIEIILFLEAAFTD